MQLNRINKLHIKQYDRRWGSRNQCVDWVTEYTYICDKSLTISEFNAIIEDTGYTIAGQLSYRKWKQKYSSGKVLYKHVLLEVMY